MIIWKCLNPIEQTVFLICNYSENVEIGGLNINVVQDITSLPLPKTQHINSNLTTNTNCPKVFLDFKCESTLTCNKVRGGTLQQYRENLLVFNNDK